MNDKFKFTVRTTLIGAILSLASASASAAGAVSIHTWTDGDNSVGAGETITSSVFNMADSAGGRAGWTGNPSLNYSGWGHAVKWLAFEVTAPNQSVSITSSTLSGNRDFGITAYASNGAFDGGTGAGDGTPHSYNAVGALGDDGTTWLNGSNGNMLQTLAYVNGGAAHNGSETDWGETINSGVNQVGDNTYFSAVSGSFGENFAQLVFDNLAQGWYTVAFGGANNSLTGLASSELSVSVNAVPLPGAVYLFGSALAGLAVSGRRKFKAA
ncbi:MAG: hypothetical protein M0R33_00385 [Methylomonas sp.]|jgi:hypothetical protein|uniref:hypothetical protein n=1 Tax=Methylomonas sp. TaxID=418 RepID=UPI0025E9E4AF|nr:hypothetical protein [Methylomonas sp.]MCK9604890.1 hypothetical protein [Methylomonas sp.]